MHHWLRRFHLITTIGGGFTGLAISLATLISSWPQLKVIAVILIFAFCVLCTWAIFVGFRLSEGADVYRELQFFYILQIPYFTTPALSFHAGFGLMLYVGALPNGQNIQGQLGTDWNAALLSNQGWLLALNVIPMVALWLLRRSNKSLERTREG